MNVIILTYFAITLSYISHGFIYEIEEANNESGLLIEKGPPGKIVRGHWKLYRHN